MALDLFRRLGPSFVVVISVAYFAGQTLAQKTRPATHDDAPLVAMAPAPPDPTEYELRYKLKTGDVLRYEVTHRASIRSTIDETTQAAQTKTDSVKLWKVTDTLPNGDIEFMNVVERVRMVNQLPDREPMEYDSEKDETPPPGFEEAARSVGVPLSTVRVTPAGEVVRREAKVRAQSDDDSPIVVRLPDKPVGIGDTWNESFDVKVQTEDGNTKSIQTRRFYKLVKIANGVATIEVKYQVLSPIDATIESQLVQRLMEGEVRFDIEAGRVVGQQMAIDKRILGFAGPASSMQYIMRMEEKLSDPPAKMTGKPAGNTATIDTPQPRKVRTSSRPRSAGSGRSYRR